MEQCATSQPIIALVRVQLGGGGRSKRGHETACLVAPPPPPRMRGNSSCRLIRQYQTTLVYQIRQPRSKFLCAILSPAFGAPGAKAHRCAAQGQAGNHHRNTRKGIAGNEKADKWAKIPAEEPDTRRVEWLGREISEKNQ